MGEKNRTRLCREDSRGQPGLDANRACETLNEQVRDGDSISHSVPQLIVLGEKPLGSVGCVPTRNYLNDP